MGILLGLATALCWGSADLLARYATRAIGTFRTMLYMQLTGLVLMTAAMHWLGGWGHLADGSGRPWMWGILVGVLNTSSTLALYRSFEIGKMSVVAPISAGYPALTMVLSAITGERLTVARFLGVVLIIVGVIVVARGEEVRGDVHPSEEKTHPEKEQLGVGWALMAGAGFGVLFRVLGFRVVPLLGSAPSVGLMRLTCGVTTAVVILLVRRPPSKAGVFISRLV